MFELMPFDRRSDRFMNRFFDDFGRDYFSNEPFGFRADIKDNGDSVTLEADLPGFKKEDISVDVSNGTLTVKAEHSEEKKDDSESYIRRERMSGSYMRSFDITGIDPEQIKAAYDSGVLKLTLPKVKERIPETKKIAIE